MKHLLEEKKSCKQIRIIFPSTYGNIVRFILNLKAIANFVYSLYLFHSLSLSLPFTLVVCLNKVCNIIWFQHSISFLFGRFCVSVCVFERVCLRFILLKGQHGIYFDLNIFYVMLWHVRAYISHANQ